MLEHRKDSAIYKNIGDRSSGQYLFVIISLQKRQCYIQKYW